jgi:hypothetical protein
MGEKRGLETAMQILRRKNDKTRRKRKIKVAKNATKNENMNIENIKPKYKIDDVLMYEYEDCGGGGISIGKVKHITLINANLWRYIFEGGECMEDRVLTLMPQN